jgi:hypothetical protein
MTVPVSNANIRITDVIRGFSRYKYQQVIYWGDQRLITFDTYNRKNYKRTGNERVMLIKKGVEYRPDLVSYDVYGTSDAWWKIMEANGMKDIMEFKAGTTIVIPDSIF